MAFQRVAAVTGANKGIGLAIVRSFALKYPTSALNSGPLLLYLTARDISRGEAALKALHNDTELKTAKALKQDGGLTDIKYHPLDVSDHTSISSFTSFLKTEHPLGIDVVVNNAGIALSGFDTDVVRQTLACNYYGTLAVTQQLLPLLRDVSTSRIVNMSSMVGMLNKYSPELTERFRSAKEAEQVTELMREFQAAVDNGTWGEKGWPGSAYAVSKAGVTGMTRCVAESVGERGGKVLVNACCPGYVATDMTKGMGRKTVEEGARTPVKLALGDLGGVSGEFWEHEEVRVW